MLLFLNRFRSHWCSFLWFEELIIQILSQTLSQALDIWNAIALVNPDLLKALIILSDTTVRQYAVEQIFYKFFKDFTNKRRKNNRPVVSSPRFSPNILKGCVHYIFTSLFCISKREHLWNKDNCFLIALWKLFSFLS